jgi:hypothetical protein
MSVAITQSRKARDIYRHRDLNTAQRAMNLLAHEPNTRIEGERVLVLRKVAPAGAVSDGTRAYSVRLCERHRYACITLGWDDIAQIDHRDTWEQPGRMVEAILEAIDASAAARREAWA